MTHNQRIILAFTLSLSIIFFWQILIAPPQPINPPKVTKPIKPQIEKKVYSQAEAEIFIKKQLKEGQRIPIHTKALTGSINLIGARIDDLKLLRHKESFEENKPVTLLSPDQTRSPYLVEFGWYSDDNIELPNETSVWEADKDTLKANDSIKLTWVNSQGAKFIITVQLDEDYMFKIRQSVYNPLNKSIRIKNFASLDRSRGSTGDSSTIIHEGLLQVADGKMQETDFEDIPSNTKALDNISWQGFSDKYWLSALISPQNETYSSNVYQYKKYKQARYHSAAYGNLDELSPNQTSTSEELLLFLGAKEFDLLNKYQLQHNIPLFDRAVDFGILYFITKPLFILLNYFYQLLGNFGFAILLLTVVIKALLFPLAYKGFKGMNKMKALHPQLTELQSKYKSDPSKLQKATIELYKREKVNPISGCLPLILQMPVFFGLYKVLYVTLEMRHAPFIGWIHDLSAPDPTSIFNLFGLLPFSTPLFLTVGVLPIIMALSMYLQQRLSPEPADPTQAKVMRLLPLIFLFTFASFPSGLVLYWAWSNVLSIAQQLLIRSLDNNN